MPLRRRGGGEGGCPVRQVCGEGKKRRRSAYTASGDVMRRWVCALLAGVVLLSGCGAGVISTARDSGDPKYVALTFDDGPSPRCTPRLLDGLLELGAKATFFVVGCQAVKDPDIVQRIAAEGHQVGNHSYDHADLHSLTSAQAMANLEKNDALLRELLGEGHSTTKRAKPK